MIFAEFSNQYRYRYMDTNTDISVSVKSIDLSLVVTTRIAANNCLQPASENGQQIVKKNVENCAKFQTTNILMFILIECYWANEGKSNLTLNIMIKLI